MDACPHCGQRTWRYDINTRICKTGHKSSVPGVSAPPSTAPPSKRSFPVAYLALVLACTDLALHFLRL